MWPLCFLVSFLPVPNLYHTSPQRAVLQVSRRTPQDVRAKNARIAYPSLPSPVRQALAAHVVVFPAWRESTGVVHKMLHEDARTA